MFFVFFMFSWFFLQSIQFDYFTRKICFTFPKCTWYTLPTFIHYKLVISLLHNIHNAAFFENSKWWNQKYSSLSFWLNPVTNYFWWKYIYIQFKFKLSLFWSDASLISRKKPMISRIKRTKEVARVVRLRVYFWLLARKLLIIFS